MKKLLVLVLISVFSCQKDFYLEDLNSANSEIEELNQQLATLGEENLSLEEANVSLSASISSLESVVEGLSKEVADLQQDVLDGENQHAILQEALAGLTTLHENAIDHIQLLNEQIDRQHTQITSLEDTNAQQAASYELLLLAQQASIEKLMQELSSVETQINTIATTTITTTTVEDATEQQPQSATETEALEIPAPSSEATGFYDDAVYSTIDFDDPNTYLQGFVKDAARYGLDLRYALEQTATFEWYDRTDSQNCAFAYACVPDSIYVAFDRGCWEDYTRYDHTNQRLLLMWHEFGHAILDYHHSCDRSSIMYSSSCVTQDVPFDGDRSSWEHFPRLAKELFTSHHIEPYPCGYTSKSLIEPIQIN